VPDRADATETTLTLSPKAWRTLGRYRSDLWLVWDCDLAHSAPNSSAYARRDRSMIGMCGEALDCW